MRSKYEIKAHKHLKEAGHIVDYKARPFRTPKGYTVDYLGMFDLLAWDVEHKTLRCIAIKGHQGVPSSLRTAIEAFNPVKITKEIWTYGRNGKLKSEELV